MKSCIKESIVEYLKNGGDFFTISTINFYRDGGTVVVETSSNTIFYIDKDYVNFYSAYPPSLENLITDNLQKIFLLHRIEQFIERQEEDTNHIKIALSKLKE